MKKQFHFLAPASMTLPVAFMLSASSSYLFPRAVPDTGMLRQDTVKVVMEKTQFKDMTVLYITDTSQTTEAISGVLGKGYGELMQYMQQNKLLPVKFIAWYYSTQPPWQMDIAVETNNIPAQLSGRIKSRIQPGGNVIIAHMWGPYDQVSKAYIRIETWLKENNKKPKGNPFEVYLNDPSAVSSPSEIRTDIYQPVE